MKTQKQLTIIVTPDNKREFLDIHRLAHTYIEQRKNVPFSLVDRLFEIMYEQSNYQDYLKWKKAYQQAALAIEKIETKKDFQFHWRDEALFENKNVKKPDTKYIFAQLIYAFSNYNEDYDIAGKDEAIAFVYKAFDEEYKAMLMPKDRKLFTPYKQAIISGILAAVMKFRVTSKANPSNAEIFEATRNAIKKYQTRKDLFSKFLRTEKI